MQVARVLPAYLDHEVDDLSARRVALHLEACQRCGLEAETYLAIKASLASRQGPVDPGALAGLRALAAGLTGGSASPTR